MPAERYYYPHPLKTLQSFTLDENEHRHLSVSMRGKAGDEVEIVNGLGTLAIARIDKIEKKSTTLTTLSTQQEPKETRRVILAQSLPRINRLDTIVEKGTELGMSELWLFPGDKSERKNLTDHQVDRLKALTIAALKQCGRLWLPPIKIMPPLPKWPKTEETILYGDLNSDTPLSKALTNKIIICIGPEAGFSESELLFLKKTGTSVSLGAHILRTDTAAIASLAIATSLI